MEIVENNNIW